jgi:hypothetical protein
MSELFSESWIKSLGKAWNNDPNIIEALNKAGFTATIAYGFIGDVHPKCLLHINNGHVTNASTYHNEITDWDLRAHPQNWEKWIFEGFGLIKLGPAVATNTLQFAQGDYRQMIRNPLLSRPFLRHFTLMTQLNTTF